MFPYRLLPVPLVPLVFFLCPRPGCRTCRDPDVEHAETRVLNMSRPGCHTMPFRISVSFGFNIPLKRLKKVMVVMAAARISLTGSARKTANTLLDKKSGRIKMRGISRISFRRHARSRTAQHRVVKKTQALNLVKRLLLPAFYYWYRSCNL